MRACKQNNALFLPALQSLTCSLRQGTGFTHSWWEMEFTARGFLLICLINLSDLLFRVGEERTKLTLHRANISSCGDLAESPAVNPRQISLSIANQASSDKSQLFRALKYFTAKNWSCSSQRSEPRDEENLWIHPDSLEGSAQLHCRLEGFGSEQRQLNLRSDPLLCR